MFSKKLVFFTIVSCVLKDFLSSKNALRYMVLSTLLYFSEGLGDENFVLPIVRNSLSDCPMPYYKAELLGSASPAQGAPAFLREFAHMAAIGWTQADGRIEWDCGGTLITMNIILTAAHCSVRDAVAPDVARMGDLDLFSDKDDEYAQQIRINKIIRHKNYEFTSNYFDIALLRLQRPIKVHDTVCPACLWNDANIEFPRLQATGWGATWFSQKRTSILLKVSLDPNSNQECDTYYEKSEKLKNGIIDSQICAGNEKIDTCPRDSGGPLQIELLGSDRLTPFIVGVTSFGPACGLSTPAVYTRVSSFIDWIENKTKTSFNPIECTLRFIEFRDYEPDVHINTQKSEYEKSELEYLNFANVHVLATYESFDANSNEALLGFRNSKREFSELSSGVLISENYVLTTASVINSNKIPPVLVKFNYSDDIIEIDKIIMHPQFNPSSNEHDIALIRLKEDVEIIVDHQLPSCLWRNPTIPARQYNGFGKGPRNINEGFRFADYNITQLRLKLDIIESAKCNETYSSNLKNVKFRNLSIISSNGITNSQFCAGYTRFFSVPGMCDLDYGNTLQHKEYFLWKEFIYDFGLNSFGKECGFGIPAVFTRISSYVDWIDSVIFGNGGTTFQRVSERDPDIHSIEGDYILGNKCMFSGKDDGECVSPERCPLLAKAFRENKYKPQLCSLQPTISICCPHHWTQKLTSQLNGKSDPNECTTRYLEEKVNYDSPDYTDRGGKYFNFYYFYNIHSPLKVGEFPHTAVITWKDAGAEKHCFGALISLNFVLTTASCVSSKKGRPESVLLGVNSAKGGGAFEQKFKILDVILHPGFLALNVFDLALIKLGGIVNVNTFVMPACLWTNTTHATFLLFSTGVSSTNEDLLVQRRLTRYNADCKKKYYHDLLDDELCGDAFLKNANNCEEKTGDILQTLWYENDVIHHYIVGFFARVNKCEVNPSIYTRITPYIDWINSIIS